MQTIGEKLEEARKRKGISIREAAETTKIRGDYLQKFEANTFEIDLPPLYLKGFLRAYARYLELDAERLVSELSSVLAEGRPARRERDNREVYGRVDFGDSSRSSETHHETPAPSRSNSGSGRSTGGGNNDNANLIKIGLIGGGALIGILVIFLLIKVIFGGPSSSRSASSTSDPVQQPAPVAAKVESAQTLTFTATDATRIKVVQETDGAVLISDSKPFIRNEARTIRKVGTLLVTVEDRTKIRMEINGRLMNIPIFPSNQGNYGQFRIP